MLPPALLLYGVLLPKPGRRLSIKDEEVVLEFLQRKLNARAEPS